MRTAIALGILLAAAAASERIEELRAALQAAEAADRYEAANALGALGTAAKDSVDELLPLLTDEQEAVRRAAARALARIGIAAEQVPALVRRLETAGDELAQLISEALATARADAVPALLAALESEEPRLRRNALVAVRLLGPPAAEAAPLLLDLAAKDDGAQRALRRLVPWAAEFVPEIEDRLRFAEEPAVRVLAAETLGRIGRPAAPAVPALRELLANEHRPLREAAGRALWRIGPPLRSEAPHPGLKDPKRAAERAPDRFSVRFETTRGAFTVELRREWAPHGVDRFFNLVSIRYFERSAFHRVLEGFVAQFGIHARHEIADPWARASIPDDPRKVPNERGTLAFAKLGPNTRAAQLFFNLRDNEGLDTQDFAPIGRVVEGLEVLDRLFSGYGEKIDANVLLYEGNAYLKRDFPELDYVLRVELVE